MSGLLSLTPGSTFASDYRIVSPLSEGGMGAVYVAEQLSTGKRRALKIMQPALVTNEKLRQRFVQEARLGSLVDSDHVVEVVSAGIDAPTGTPWLAMELLTGETLAHRVERGSLSHAEIREVFSQLCHALGRAHDAGIVHRDLKPENIFLAVPRRQGAPFVVKVLDFGIAKLVAEAQTRHTAPLGTPLWMAPEQTDARGIITPASDVWALGLIAFHLLTRRHYWLAAHREGTSAMTLLREVVMDPLEPASVRAAHLGALALPAGFDDWFARCVVRQVESRFSHARSAHDALDAVLGGSPLTRTGLMEQPVLTSRAPGAATTAPNTFDEPALPITRKRGGVSTGHAAGAVIGVAAIVVGAYFAFRSPAATDEPTTPGTDVVKRTPSPVATTSATTMNPGDGGEATPSGDYRSLNEQADKALASGEVGRAELLFKAALAQHPRDIDALYGLGQIARTKGDHGGAISYFRQVLEASPGFSPARLALADEQWATNLRNAAVANYKLYLDRVSEGSGADRARERTGKSAK